MSSLTTKDTEYISNIVLIVADDLGWADVGWNNSLMLDVTPRLSKLAKSGVILNQ